MDRRREARRPIWFHRPDGGLISSQASTSTGRPPGHWQRTFTIVTTRANDLIAPVHDRMPVILDEADADAWLDPNPRDLDALTQLLVPAPESLLTATPVSPRANSVKNDDPDCLLPRPTLL